MEGELQTYASIKRGLLDCPRLTLGETLYVRRLSPHGLDSLGHLGLKMAERAVVVNDNVGQSPFGCCRHLGIDDSLGWWGRRTRVGAKARQQALQVANQPSWRSHLSRAQMRASWVSSEQSTTTLRRQSRWSLAVSMSNKKVLGLQRGCAVSAYMCVCASGLGRWSQCSLQHSLGLKKERGVKHDKGGGRQPGSAKSAQQHRHNDREVCGSIEAPAAVAVAEGNVPQPLPIQRAVRVQNILAKGLHKLGGMVMVLL